MVEDVNALKTKGNEAFAHEDYPVALDFYSKAIDEVKASVPKNESEIFWSLHLFLMYSSDSNLFVRATHTPLWHLLNVSYRHGRAPANVFACNRMLEANFFSTSRSRSPDRNSH